MPQNRPKSKTRLLNVYTISHGHRIFARMQVGGLGGSGGGGKAANRQKSARYVKLHGVLDLKTVKTKFIIIYCLKSMDRAF
jgi:hypothetical protein